MITPKVTTEKSFVKVWKHIFDLAAKNAEQQLSGGRVRTKKAEKEYVAFLHDHRNARKMQMSTLDHDSRQKWQRKRQRVETEDLKVTQAISSKTANNK